MDVMARDVEFVIRKSNVCLLVVFAVTYIGYSYSGQVVLMFVPCQSTSNKYFGHWKTALRLQKTAVPAESTWLLSA